MNDVYIKSNHTVKSISFKYLIALIPLIIGGFYKNGIHLYNHDLVNLVGLFKPLIYTSLGFIIGALVNYIYNKFILRTEDDIIEMIFSSFHPVYGVVISSVISINTNIILFILVTFTALFVSKFLKKAKINTVAIAALAIILIFNLTKSFTFLNIYEQTKVLNLGTLDYLIGKGSGGINTTFIIFLLLSFIYLANQDFYKSRIPVFSALIFSVLIILYSIYQNQIGIILDYIFVNGTLFSFVFIAPDSLSSSYTRKGQIIFGSLIGLITFILFLIEPSLAALGAILIISLLHQLIDQICQKQA